MKSLCSLHKTRFLWSLLLVPLAVSCQKRCDDEYPTEEYRLSQAHRGKMAYTGNETLVFREIVGDDTTTITFKPDTKHDTVVDYEYYDSTATEKCIKVQKIADRLYRSYYSVEQDRFFEVRMFSNGDLRLLFREGVPQNLLANLDIRISADDVSNRALADTSQSTSYLGEYYALNGKNEDVTKVTLFGWQEKTYYDTKNGLIEWRLNWVGSMELVEIIRP